MFYTYLLRCKDGSLYAGITTDPARRLKEHRSGGKKGARYTRFRAPCSMVAVWESESRSTAAKLEALLKRTKHDVKERLVLKPERMEELLAVTAGVYKVAADKPDGH